MIFDSNLKNKKNKKYTILESDLNIKKGFG
jgi:hypothetical protein